MFKKSLYLILFVSLHAFSQNTTFEISTSGLLYTNLDGFGTDKNIEGSPYVNVSYLPSHISCFSGTTPAMRYNALKDEMEFLDKNKIYYVVKRDSCEIKLANKKYKYLTCQTKEGQEKGYLVVASNEVNKKFSLYKKEKIILVPEHKGNSSYQETRPAYYKLEDEKFYLGFSNKVVFMPRKEKEIIALLPNHAAAIESFIKLKKISLKLENDLISLVQYMNTLE